MELYSIDFKSVVKGEYPIWNITQVSVEPIAAGTGFVDEDQMLGLGWELARELIEVGLSGADRAEVSDFGTVIVSDIGDRDGVFVNIQTDEKIVGEIKLDVDSG
jgi:hypothetical protein